jgi:phosphate transport system protein
MSPETATGFRHFHDQLATLKQRLLDMSQAAEELVELSVEALLTRDRGKAEAVIVRDHEIDQHELDVERLGIELLATQQPMARDLRFLIGAIKVSSDLERVGDHAVNIAQSAIRLTNVPATITPSPEIEDMARRARAMLSDALDAFLRGDGRLGREVCQADDQVDALHDSVFRILLTHMMADPATIQRALSLILIARNLERVGDHATNIAEEVIYWIQGRDVRHTKGLQPAPTARSTGNGASSSGAR